MQAQTTRTFNRNVQKLAGGLLIAAALAAGALGLTTVGNLELPGAGSSTSHGVTNPVIGYTAVNAGEGLVDRSSLAIEASHGEGLLRSVDAPQGEGYPRSLTQPVIFAVSAGAADRARIVAAPQGEGFPMNALAQAGQQESAPLGEGLPMSSGQ